MRRWPLCALLAPACALVLGARAAAAEPNDAPAGKLRDEAIYTDYLAVKYADAEMKLKTALALCKDEGACSATARARLHGDLGVVEIMLKRAGAGRAELKAALHDDPALVLDADLATPDLQREFAAVKSGEGDAPDAPAGAAGAEGADCPPSFPGCSADAKASDDEASQAEAPAAPPAPYKRNWFSVAFEQDALLLPSANNTCAGGTGYTCFGSDGSYYADTPLAGADDGVGGGLALGTSRILVGYDRALWPNVTLGARAGYAFGGGPQRPTGKSFLPLHLEARAAYWFGDDPLGRAGLRFYVLAAGGIAEQDANISVDVYASMQSYQSGQSQEYEAWKKTGLAFGAVGAGAMYAITPATGVSLEAKAMEMFPTAAPGLGLQLAYLVGL